MERTPRKRKAICDDRYIYYDEVTQISIKCSPNHAIPNSTTTNTDECNNVTTSSASYCLNVEKALKKKKNSCDKDLPINVNCTSSNVVIDCSTAGFELLKKHLLVSLSTYYVCSSYKKDKSGAVESECFRVYHNSVNKKKSKFIVAINFYNTTSSVLINGNQLTYFNDNILPNVVKMVNAEYVPEMDYFIKSVIVSGVPKVVIPDVLPDAPTTIVSKEINTENTRTDVLQAFPVVPNDVLPVPNTIVITDVLPLLPITEESSPITDEDKSSQNLPIKNDVIMSTHILPIVDSLHAGTCNQTNNILHTHNDINILSNDSVHTSTNSILHTPGTQNDISSDDGVLTCNVHNQSTKKKKVKSVTSTKLNKSPVFSAITPINKKIENVNSVLFSINEQHVETTNELCDIKNKFNERCNQLENAISSVRKTVSALSTNFQGNYEKLNNSVKKLDNICCSQYSTFEMMLAESIEKMNIMSKSVKKDVENSKCILLADKSNIINEITLSVNDAISPCNVNNDTLAHISEMSDKFSKESDEAFSLLSTFDERLSTHNMLFSALNNRLTALSTRVDNFFVHLTESNVNDSNSVSSNDIVVNDVQVSTPINEQRKKRFNPFSHNFDPSTHRLFRGRKDPLSNMFTHGSCKCKCVLNVNTFGHSGCFDFSEKAFTYYKALFNYRYDLLDPIYKCSDPFDCKKIGDNIRVYDNWMSIRERVMLDIQMDKYIGCISFRNDIHVNRNKFIVENTSDPFWGRGIDNTGLNVLGRIHMQLVKLIYSV